MAHTPDAVPARDEAVRDDAAPAPAPASSAAAPGRRRRVQLPFWASVLLNVAVALLVVSVVQALWVKVYSVPSGSMEQTLQVGDRMLVNRTAYPDGVAERQDIVVFDANETWGVDTVGEEGPVEGAVRTFGDLTGIGRSHENALVKRVIGLPGETVECCTSQGVVTVGGTPLEEDYLYEDLPFVPGTLDCTTTPRSSRCFGPVTVPERSMLVMGDHRSNSADSVYQCRGLTAEQAGDCAHFVRDEDVVGRVFSTVWPPSNWSGH